MSAQLTCPKCSVSFRVTVDAIPADGRTVKCGKCSHQWVANRADLEFPSADNILEEHAAQTAEEPEIASDEIPEKVENAESTENAEDAEQEEIAIENNLPDELLNSSLDKKTSAKKESSKDEALKAEKVVKRLAQKKQKPKLKPSKPKKIITSKMLTKRLAVGASCMFVLFACTGFIAWRDGIRHNFHFTESLYDMLGYPSSDGIKLADLSLSRINLSDKNRYIINGSFVNTSTEERQMPILRIKLLDEHGETLKMIEGTESKMLDAGAFFSFSPKIDSKFIDSEHKITVEIGNDLELSRRD
jgi:predicted Zn finger-like uncharacterized protein